MFDDKCKPVYDLGGGPYNTVLWNPFGRFLAIAGFGNLPGEAELFEGRHCGVVSITSHVIWQQSLACSNKLYHLPSHPLSPYSNRR